MNRVLIDWKALRGAFSLLLVAVLVGGALVASERWLNANVERSALQARATLLALRAQYQSIDQERRSIERNLPRYRSLRAAGIIGAERRLSWVEGVRRAARSVEAPSLRYDIGRRRTYRPGYPVPGGVLRIYASDMRLEMGLYQEGDLLTILAVLRRRAHGLYSVRGCTLARSRVLFDPDPRKANVHARCLLQWYTLSKPGAA